MKSFFAFLCGLFKLVDSRDLSVRDKFWVLEAVIRGRVLGQGLYRMHVQTLSQGLVLMSFRVPMTPERRSALSSLWGYRPASLRDLLCLRMSVVLYDQQPRYFRWTGEAWSLQGPEWPWTPGPPYLFKN